MIPLFLISVISITLILERCWFWFLVGGRGSLTRLNKLNSSFRKSDDALARKLVQKDGSPYGEIATASLAPSSKRVFAISP